MWINMSIESAVKRFNGRAHLACDFSHNNYFSKIFCFMNFLLIILLVELASLLCLGKAEIFRGRSMGGFFEIKRGGGG